MTDTRFTWRTSGMVSSLSGDWETPQDMFDSLNQEFHFVLDVCATRITSKAPKYFTWTEDALHQDWLSCSQSRPVWMNPPYGRAIGLWVCKAWQESKRGCTVVCLLPSRTDTSWWHDYCLEAGEIRFIRGRLYFVRGSQNGRAPFPSCIIVFRPRKGPTS